MANSTQEVKDLKQALEGIVAGTAVASGSSVLNNGDQVLFTLTTVNNAGAKVMVVPDLSVYIGSVDALNQLPGGGSIDESQWQVIGPWSDWGATDNVGSKWMIYIQNISAGASQTVILEAISRVIANTITTPATGP